MSAYRLLRLLAPSPVPIELFRGVRVELDLTDDTQRAAYCHGWLYESPTPAVLSDWADSCDAFFDIGANFGFYSLLMLSLRRGIDVYAFEPQADPRRVLQGASAPGTQHLHVSATGLADKDGVLELHAGATDSGHATFGAHPVHGQSPGEPTAVTTFDSWRRKAGIPLPQAARWIAKIDVEGYEPRVLSGMREALEAKAFRGIVVEINAYTLKFCGASESDVLTPLAEAGYRRLPTPDGDAGPDCNRNEFFVPA